MLLAPGSGLKSAMLNQRHPAAILRGAWSNFRLDAIRNVVNDTIRELGTLDATQVLGRDPLPLEVSADDGPLRLAFAMCCEELRKECGMPAIEEPSTHANLRSTQDADWVASYINALDRYRDVAGATLEASLARL
jgi:hypothetical protein